VRYQRGDGDMRKPTAAWPGFLFLRSHGLVFNLKATVADDFNRAVLTR
jgi:hypothetical protein